MPRCPCRALLLLILIAAGSGLSQSQDDQSPDQRIAHELERLSAVEAKVRGEATRNLREWGRRTEWRDFVRRALQKAATDGEVELRVRAGELLQWLENQDRMPAGVLQTKEFSELLERGKGYEACRQALGSRHGFTAGEWKFLLAEALRQANTRSIEEKLDLLQWVGAKNARELAGRTADFLRDPDEVVRQAASWALCALKAKEQVTLIAALLKDPDPRIRKISVESLGRLQAGEFLSQVLDRLEDPDAGVRRSAVCALGSLPGKDCGPILIELLRDPDEVIRRNAAESLVKQNAWQLAPHAAKLLEDQNQQVRGSVVRALGMLGSKECLPQVEALIQDRSEERRVG